MERKDREKALAANELSPIRTLAALSALTDKELVGLEEHVTKKAADIKAAAEKEAADKKAADEKAAADKKAADEATARAAGAPKPMTPAEWFASAPPEVRALVEDAKQRDEEIKTNLVNILKSAQKEFNETELKAMGSKELARIAKLVGVDPSPTPDYSGLGLPRANNTQDTDVYRNPPNGYRMALDARKEKVN